MVIGECRGFEVNIGALVTVTHTGLNRRGVLNCFYRDATRPICWAISAETKQPQCWARSSEEAARQFFATWGEQALIGLLPHHLLPLPGLRNTRREILRLPKKEKA
ncbi:hypothetical protein ZHS_81 [Edwardsiella phage vB_EpM_ZHS]|nr:hypothetical protein ZHS_81 [Edwardsiella phage vB_EpM_ZHS]